MNVKTGQRLLFFKHDLPYNISEIINDEIIYDNKQAPLVKILMVLNPSSIRTVGERWYPSLDNMNPGVRWEILPNQDNVKCL